MAAVTIKESRHRKGSAQNKHLVHCGYYENRLFHLSAPSLTILSCYFGERRKMIYSKWMIYSMRREKAKFDLQTPGPFKGMGSVFLPLSKR